MCGNVACGNSGCRPGVRGDDGMKKKHVAVLLGGFSSERPVSLSSGKACADALENEGYQVTRIDVSRDVGSVRSEERRVGKECGPGRSTERVKNRESGAVCR